MFAMPGHGKAACPLTVLLAFLAVGCTVLALRKDGQDDVDETEDDGEMQKSSIHQHFKSSSEGLERPIACDSNRFRVLPPSPPPLRWGVEWDAVPLGQDPQSKEPKFLGRTGSDARSLSTPLSQICCNGDQVKEEYPDMIAAEGRWYYQTHPDFKQEVLDARNKNESIIFYCSVCGTPLFVLHPNDRKVGLQFFDESDHHGWPSFRDQDLFLDAHGLPNLDTYNLKAFGPMRPADIEHFQKTRMKRLLTNEQYRDYEGLSGGYEVHCSHCGAHVGDNVPDDFGNRFCIDAGCIAGTHEVSNEASTEVSIPASSPATCEITDADIRDLIFVDEGCGETMCATAEYAACPACSKDSCAKKLCALRHAQDRFREDASRFCQISLTDDDMQTMSLNHCRRCSRSCQSGASWNPKSHDGTAMPEFQTLALFEDWVNSTCDEKALGNEYQQIIDEAKRDFEAFYRHVEGWQCDPRTCISNCDDAIATVTNFISQPGNTEDTSLNGCIASTCITQMQTIKDSCTTCEITDADIQDLVFVDEGCGETMCATAEYTACPACSKDSCAKKLCALRQAQDRFREDASRFCQISLTDDDMQTMSLNHCRRCSRSCQSKVSWNPKSHDGTPIPEFQTLALFDDWVNRTCDEKALGNEYQQIIDDAKRDFEAFYRHVEGWQCDPRTCISNCDDAIATVTNFISQPGNTEDTSLNGCIASTCITQMQTVKDFCEPCCIHVRPINRLKAQHEVKSCNPAPDCIRPTL